eukprot:UN33475
MRTSFAHYYERAALEFSFDDQLLNKSRPFMNVPAPNLPKPILEKLRGLTHSFLQQPQFIKSCFEIPGMKHILFEMELITDSVRECAYEDLTYDNTIDKSMFHFGLLICFSLKKILELKHNIGTPLCLTRFVSLHSDPKVRFCFQNQIIIEFCLELYGKPEYMKKIRDLELDVLSGLFMDMVDCPIMLPKVFPLLNSLHDDFWHKASIKTLHIAFEFVFIPWLEDYLIIELDEEMEADLESFLWLLTSSKYF